MSPIPASPPGPVQRAAARRDGVSAPGAEVLRTIYCGATHRMSDGLPVAHACRVLDPAFLMAERERDIPRAVTLLERMPLQLHPGVPPDASPRRR
jgi:hypothetical protein